MFKMLTSAGITAEECPISFTADIIGDKWSIIILRDIALLNRPTFNQLKNKNIEGISSSILAKRLKRLEDIGLLTIRYDPAHRQKKIYCLTDPAIQFIPLIFALGRWARMFNHALADPNTPLGPCYDGDAKQIASFIEGLREIHLRGASLAEVDPIFALLAS
jgi:DNA-binding HxlR family transcriptional regulator